MIKKIYKALPILFLLITPLFLSQCAEETENATEEIDTEKIDLKIKFQRFDEDLFSAKNAQEIAALEKKYPDFYPVYMYQIMGDITETNQSALEAAANLMRNFSTIPDFGLGLKQRADSVFGNMEPFKKELTEAMKRYKYYFPKDTIPEFVTFISPLRINFPVIEGKNILGIGLDLYLGSDFRPYHSFNLADQFPGYRIRKMRKDYLLRDLVTAMCQNKLKPLGNNSRLLDEMIYEGKILYMVNSFIPETKDSIKLGYTPEQLKWAKQNESNIWAALVDSKVLYVTEPDEIRHYINDGPFTTAKGFGAGTAPRIGAYTGWQIVKKYMAKNPQTTLQQLLAETDADDILNKSKYKP
jgi:hypothetical protein